MMDELQARRDSKLGPAGRLDKAVRHMADLSLAIERELERLGTGVQRLADEWETTKPDVSRRLRDLLAGRDSE